MHIAINAVTIRPGGGLTVIRGLLTSLRIARPDWTITVLTSSEDTYQWILKLRLADSVDRILPDASSGFLFAWQNTQLGYWLARRGVDALITVNHFLAKVRCTQIVYHLNALRFARGVGGSSLWVCQEWLRNVCARMAISYADVNVFESQYLQQLAEVACGRRARNSRVIYIGVPDELLSLPRRQAKPSLPPRRIVAITSPAAHKDNATLIRTIAALASADPESDWRLDIAGGGGSEVWDTTRALARDLRVLPRVTWHGFCDQQKLSGLLYAAHCLVSTSRVESFAMVALEAMARGCPPVVADCAAMPESIGDAGILAEAGNPMSFVAAIQQLAVMPAHRDELIKRGYAWVQKFRWTDCGASFASLIDQQLNASP